MRIETLGHATLLLSDPGGRAVLATDPWLVGSCYWRSWWLENSPTPQQIERVAAARWIYLTHEHPDHLHPPSLRRLGARAEVLLPDFPALKMEAYLASEGWRTRRLVPAAWTLLEPGLRVMSLPLWNNDSILLIETPEALVVNLNDAKPDAVALARIGALNRALGKRCVLLRSYSPAAPVNSYFRDGERLAGRGYAKAVQRACRLVGADDYIPFASQVVFGRPDTEWANAYKVRHRDLERAWRAAGTRLLAPYSALDLATGEARAPAVAEYRAPEPERVGRAVAAQMTANAAARWDEADRRRLQSVLRALYLPLLFLFPRGFAIRADGVALAWESLRGRLVEARRGGHFALNLPLLPLKEALANGHAGDLCIPMFMTIDLFGATARRRVDVFFMLLILRDCGYLGALPRTLAWLLWSAKVRRARRRPLPLPARSS